MYLTSKNGVDKILSTKMKKNRQYNVITEKLKVYLDNAFSDVNRYFHNTISTHISKVVSQ